MSLRLVLGLVAFGLWVYWILCCELVGGHVILFPIMGVF